MGYSSNFKGTTPTHETIDASGQRQPIEFGNPKIKQVTKLAGLITNPHISNINRHLTVFNTPKANASIKLRLSMDDYLEDSEKTTARFSTLETENVSTVADSKKKRSPIPVNNELLRYVSHHSTELMPNDPLFRFSTRRTKSRRQSTSRKKFPTSWWPNWKLLGRVC